MLSAGWIVLLSLLSAFIFFGEGPEKRRWIFYFGFSVTVSIYIFLCFTSNLQIKDPMLLAMIFHLPLFFAYSVAFWCHTDLLKSIFETVAAYLVVSLVYLLVRDNMLLSLALVLSTMGAQWLIITTYFQMHPDDFLYDDAR